jgi:ribosomal protein L37AE/L43A
MSNMDEKNLEKIQAQKSYKMANEFHEGFLYSVTTAEELKVVDTLLKELARTDSLEIVLPASYVKERTKSTKKGNYLKHLYNMAVKIGHMGLTYSTKQYPMVYQNWFRKVEVDEHGNLKATFDEFFKEYFDNNMQKRYTLVLDEKMDLKSKYSLKLYDYLQRWHYEGECRIEMQDFRKILGIPSKYNSANIDQRVLNENVIHELSIFFKNLSVEKIYEKHRRGRPAVAAYVFHFKAEKPRIPMSEIVNSQESSEVKQAENNKIHKMRTQTVCPVCGETSVAELTARDGHRFWKCESCKQTFGSMAEVRGYSETPSRTLKMDDTETKSEEVYIPGIEEINQLKKSLSMKSAKTVNDKTDEQKSEEHIPEKKVVNPVPVKHDITQCANPMARALDAIIWPYVERNALDYPIIPKGELRKVLGMDKSYSDEDLLTMLKEALSVLVDLGWYDDIQIQVGNYKNGNLKDVLLMPFVKISQA